MHISVAKKRFVRRLVGHAINPLQARVRRQRGQQQHYRIGGHPVVLPPEHNLPFYQRRDPTYDTYAETLVADIAADLPHLRVIDLGANVGDTAVAMLTSADGVDVVAVEGSPRFVEYLRRNTADFGHRVRIVDAFVGPVGSHLAFNAGGSTGGFQQRAGGSEVVEAVTAWVTPAELLAGGESYDATIWKSDIDGFDIHVLVEHWDVISSACAVLWFEFDPAATLGDRDDVDRLVQLLATSGRRVVVYDNLGRRMLHLLPGDAVAAALSALSQWLVQQRDGHLTVPYVDIWAYDDERLTSIAQEPAS